MMKCIIISASVMLSMPAFAQEASKRDGVQAAPEQAPATEDPAAAAQAVPAQPATEPARDVAQDAPTAQPAAVAAAAEPVATPAATQEQVAQAVGRDFGGYDKNGDGKLDATEFAAWMGALRKAAEPSFQPGSAEATTWTNQAFASADTDKSASVNKQELTVFLTPKQPG